MRLILPRATEAPPAGLGYAAQVPQLAREPVAGILSNRGLDPRPLRRARRSWIFANPCRRANLGRCVGRLELARPGAHTAFASARFTHNGNVRVHLGPTAARRLARTSRVAIRIRAKQLVFQLGSRRSTSARR